VRLLIYATLLLAACSAGGDDASLPSAEPAIQVVGKLENSKLNEASGLARSSLADKWLWVINDSGPAAVHAIDQVGNELGRVKITHAKNVDWEDLASFEYEGIAYLAVADIGDNEARRAHVTVYVIEEPEPESDEVDVAWRVDFTYPDGPRDAESLAVDAVSGHIYVLSKREIPAVLFELPLLPTDDDVTVAKRLVAVKSLPQPSAAERRNAKGSGWYWQPTAMDFSADGLSALILTYSGVYFFSRDAQQSWPEVLNTRALELKLGKIKNAESLAFGSDRNTAFLTIEKKRAPLMQIDLSSAAAPIRSENTTE
jgi:hypothetical protein